MARKVMHLLFVLALAVLLSILSCGDVSELGARSIANASSRDGGTVADADSRLVEFELPPLGITDRGRTSGLMLIEVGTAIRCSGALVGSNVVLAPASCVARDGCKALAAGALTVRGSDPVHEVLSEVAEVLLSDMACDPSALAALVLATHVDGVWPLVPRARPAVVGEFVRWTSIDATKPHPRRLRDHLRVDASTRRDFRMPGGGEGCATLPGGIAIDESTGELLGLSAAGSCGASITFTQLDAERALLAAAWSRASAPRPDADGGLVDAGLPRRGKPVRPTLDLGEPCEIALECAAGVCVFEGSSSYCSRSCGPGDRCPATFRCEHMEEGRSACVRS